MAHTLILGAGFGGISTAVELRSLLGAEHRITVVARDPSFMMGLRKLWALVGAESLEGGTRSVAGIARLGIDVVQATVNSIDADARTVHTTAGNFEADYLVVALGAETRPDLVTGLAEHGHNVWRAASVPAAKQALDGLTRGRLLILIAGAPYPCPPAPYECAMLIDEHLRQEGRRDAIELAVSTIQPLLMPNAGKEGSDWVGARLAERGIAFQTGKRITRVEERQVVYEDGSEPFDMLICVPPHRPPAVIAESGLLADSGWMAVDPGTLETRFPGVYAVGDVTLIRLANGLPLPKAGAIAELEGTRVARAIAASVLGREPAPPFDGTGVCFIEMGMNEASLVNGEFYAQPEPRVELAAVSAANAALKRSFESDRLQRWFGR